MERLLNLPFTVEIKRSEDKKLVDALTRMYDEGSELDESVDNNVANNINCNCVAKKDLQEMFDCFTDLPPNLRDRQTDIQNNSGQTYFWNIINELPLAFTDLKQHNTMI